MTVPLKTTEFMLQLHHEIVDKKKVAESTASNYVKALYMLNNKVPFKTLTFLKDTEHIMKVISEYADSTQKTILTGLASVLSLMKDKPTYKRVYQFYYDQMMGKAKEMKEGGPESGQKTEKQKENWVEWEHVQHKRDEMGKEVAEFANKKAITPQQFSHLLSYTILSLYTTIQPRRNQDYLDMYVVRSKKVDMDELDKTKNWLVVEEGEPKVFVFNKFKTAKTYGQQVFTIPPELASVLSIYLRHHPLSKSKDKTHEFKFLVSADEKPLVAGNAITRILNKLFGKKVGSSMLRHIFLSSKYGDVQQEQDADAAAMGHSRDEAQHTYVKYDKPNQSEPQ